MSYKYAFIIHGAFGTVICIVGLYIALCSKYNASSLIAYSGAMILAVPAGFLGGGAWVT